MPYSRHKQKQSFHPFDHLADFHRGSLAVAERRNMSEQGFFHVSTSLEKYILSRIEQGYDIIVTGNSGDGKTHLLAILEQQGALRDCYVEKDASQISIENLLAAWDTQRKRQRRSIIAINHAPLQHAITSASAYPTLYDLTNITHDLMHTFYYHDKPEKFQSSTIVIDLGQREILTSEVITEVVKKMTSTIKHHSCTSCPAGSCPVTYNALALSNTLVLHTLITLLTLVTRSGFHATMRELLGFIAYILTGGISCTDRWKVRSNGGIDQSQIDNYIYYNLIFSGEGSLFDAIRTIFDPADYPDPYIDRLLWEGEINTQWIFSTYPTTLPSNIHQFRILKRRYFFEHDHPTEEMLKRLLPASLLFFDALIKETVDNEYAVEELISLINHAYVSSHQDFSADLHTHLRLWHIHRYSMEHLPGAMAMHSIPANAFTITRPQIAPHLEGAFQTPQDHVLLGLSEYKQRSFQLRIDWPLYQALVAGKHGLPLTLQPFNMRRRLATFLSNLQTVPHPKRPVETIEWYDYQKRRPTVVRINRVTKQYEMKRADHEL